ncbi:MAG TPA: hypothetical protein VMZ92_11630 [Planctomycetota bacterium]|nr:hypothetical protein [Planctomycetota bacterium]
MKPVFTIMVVLLALPVLGAGEAETLFFDFTTPREMDEWHGGTAVHLNAPGTVVELEPGGEPFWTCWSMPQDWEPFAELVIELDLVKGGKDLCVAVSDDEEYTVALETTLEHGGTRTIRVPVKQLYESGIQTQHVRGVALFTRVPDVAVRVRKVALAGKGGDLSASVRRGTRMLADAEGRDADFFWSYSHWARRVAAVEKHPVSGKRSFEMKFAGKSPVSGWGRFAHDWRGYDALAFDVFNPKDKPVTLTVELKDTWVSFFSKAYVSSHAFELPPGATTKLSIPLAGLEGKQGGSGAVGRLNLKYVQQMLFRVDEASQPVDLYVDNIRLVGKPGQAFANAIPAAELPKFGFEHASAKLKLPADLHKITVGAPGAASTLKAGAARVKITPKVGTRMASVSSNSEGILDDIYVRVLLLQEDGKDLVAWLHIDNLYMPGRVEMPPILQEKLGVKPENIFWSATHTHNSGAPWASKAFTEQIIAGFTEAAEAAAARMNPVRVGIARTNARFNFNRVMKGPDGNTYSTLDAKYMTFLLDSRETDTELATIWFVGDDAQPVAAVVYYTGHANMLCRVMPWISGDWSGWTERLLEDASGAVVMHVQGPLGDTDMRDICIGCGRTIRAGWDVAYASMRATQTGLTSINPSTMAGVGIRHGEGIGTPNEKQAQKGATEHKLPVHVLTIGPVAFCDLGGEVWTRFALEVRAKSPFPHTYLNFSSGYYYPEEWAFEKKSYGTQDRMPDWGGVLRDTTVKLLGDAAGK